MKLFYWLLSLFWVITLVVFVMMPNEMGMMVAMYMMIFGMLAHSIACALEHHK
ncbi:hypothetical protein [Fructilactobacillus carniphilus]|uniref:DUF1145 domain-containing protein n=1 Tax=Fructilactobacillus carniphilus TaxID=2940297 RepID=A0ABY5BZE4_9LACO|nr:hypothetical protein [Fructilactobacillus carniphilus]USS90415.1 hypothetical protein M3M37_06140 [Fructilactobacillus carniphilus]